ncbi:MAG: hypothetical protein ACK4Z8_09840 [Novosphingobium sp.]
MSHREQALVRSVSIILGVVLTWIAAFSFNEWAFAGTAQSARANWIFLPASVRLLAVLLFGKLGAMGLAMGAFLAASTETQVDWAYNAGLVISSGIAPLLAVTGYCKIVKIGPDLAGLGPASIVALSVAAAATNAVLLNGYLYAISRLHTGIKQIAIVFVGDTLGTAIVLMALSGLLTIVMPKRR